MFRLSGGDRGLPRSVHGTAPVRDPPHTHGQAPLYLLAILQRPTRSSGCASEGGSEVHEVHLLAHATRRAPPRDALFRAMHRHPQRDGLHPPSSLLTD